MNDTQMADLPLGIIGQLAVTGVKAGMQWGGHDRIKRSIVLALPDSRASICPAMDGWKGPLGFDIT